MPAPAVAVAAVPAAPVAAGAAVGGTVLAFPVAATGATVAGGVVTAEALLPALLAAGGVLVTAGGLALAGGAMSQAALDGWRAFSAQRIPELQAEGMSYADAQKRAGKEYKEGRRAEGGTVSDGAKLKGVRGLSSLRAEIPFQVKAEPDLAAAWDIAEGLIDELMEHANPGNGDAFRRQAAAAYARAKGITPEVDQTEHDFGRSIAKALILVLGHRGVTADDWAAMAPPELGQASSFLSRGVEAVTGVDVNDDGDASGFGDVITGAVGAAGNAVLPFLE